MEYKDQSEEGDDDVKKARERIEARLQGNPINYFTLNPGRIRFILCITNIILKTDSSFAICGYERGSVAVISTKYYESTILSKSYRFNLTCTYN